MKTKKSQGLKRGFLLIGAGVILYFLTRLINLTLIPIFTDEAIYIRWGQIASSDSAQRFIALTDGKQPLLIWLFVIFQRLPFDILFSSRLVSVLSGLISLIGLGLVSWRLWQDKGRAILSSLLYLIIPFFLFFDRLAIYDSLLVATVTACLFFEILLAQTLRLDVALLLGMIIGTARLVKSSALFSILLLPLSLLLIKWPKKRKEKLRIFGRWLVLSLIAIAISEGINTILRLSPLYYMINLKNHTFIVSVADFIKEPFMYFLGNLRGLSGWLFGFMTWPVILMILVSLLKFREQLKKKLFLLAWFILPFAALASVGKVIYPRFILFMALSLVPLAADGLLATYNFFKKKRMAFLSWALFFFLLIPIKIDFDILFQPSQANIPLNAKNQYIRSWPSGGGVKEAIAFLKEKSQSGPIFVGTEGTFGLMPFSLEIYLGNNPNIEIKGYWPVGEVPEEAIVKAKEKPSFFVFYQKTEPPPKEWPLELVSEYQKDDPDYSLRLYQVKP